jgi:hypothetical protein
LLWGRRAAIEAQEFDERSDLTDRTTTARWTVSEALLRSQR